MSAPNFNRMNCDMPLIVGGLYCEDDFDFDVAWDNAMWKINKFAEENNLQFYSLGLQSGRYEGFQFQVYEIYANEFDLDQESPYCIDNETAKNYFGMYRSQVLRKAEAERRKIEKWLENLDNLGEGFEWLVCTAIFSNGEAIYDRHDNKRAQLKSKLLSA